LCEPNSKLGLWIEWLNKVYLPGTEELKLEHLYEAMDLLYRHLATIEEQVFSRIIHQAHMNLDTTYQTFITSLAEPQEMGL